MRTGESASDDLVTAVAETDLRGLTVLLLGRRPGAIAAARGLGLEILVLAETAGGRSGDDGVAAARRCDFSGHPAGWRATARELYRRRRIAAVLATAERTVVPAAVLRRDLGLPGLSPAAARRATDKLAMKRAVGAAGLAVADFVDGRERPTAAELVARLGLPVVVKPRRSSGGRGRRVAREVGELPARLAPGWLAERFVTGTEMSVEALVAGGRPIFLNFTEYLDPLWANLVPADLAPATAETLGDLTATAVRALGVERGFVHLELFLTAEGPVFGELAARPPGGHLMELIATVYGFDPWRAWLEIELGAVPTVHHEPQGAAAVRVLHPGAGRLRVIEGVDAARGLPGVRRVSLRVVPGAEIGERLGSGQEAGHVLVTDSSREATRATLRRASELIRFELEPLG